MKKKKLFLVSGLAQGGLETYLLRFSEWAKDQDCAVFCKSGKEGVLAERFRNLGLTVYARRLGVADVVAFWRFYRFLCREHFAVVCDFTGNFSGIPLFCAKLAGVKVRIAQYRGAEDHFKRTFVRRIYNAVVKRLTYHCATKIISNSNAALDYFYPKVWKTDPKFTVIRNGANLHAFREHGKDARLLRREFGIPEMAFVVGHTGRCNYAKNHDTIIEVAIRLCRKCPDVFFLLIGLDVDKIYAKRVAQEALTERIIMPGYRQDVPRLLSLMDLFYFPSVTEGQPNSLIEAEIAGLPIVASNIAPIREAVPESFAKKLVPPRDADLAADLIEKLYRDEDLRNSYVCQTWAMQNFDGNLRFEEFRKELN